MQSHEQTFRFHRCRAEAGRHPSAARRIFSSWNFSNSMRLRASRFSRIYYSTLISKRVRACSNLKEYLKRRTERRQSHIRDRQEFPRPGHSGPCARGDRHRASAVGGRCAGREELSDGLIAILKDDPIGKSAGVGPALDALHHIFSTACLGTPLDAAAIDSAGEVNRRPHRRAGLKVVGRHGSQTSQPDLPALPARDRRSRGIRPASRLFASGPQPLVVRRHGARHRQGAGADCHPGKADAAYRPRDGRAAETSGIRA